MAHLTFIHGISNKPPAEKLLAAWQQFLADNDGLDLGTSGVTCSMVYWADVLYETPVSERDVESVNEFENNAAIAREQQEDPSMSWRNNLQGDERRFVDSLAAKLSFDVLVDDTFAPPVEAVDRTLERIPLPWFIKRRIMKQFLRDVHHYLFNATFSPRAGVSYQVQDEIRRRTVAVLQSSASKKGPHVIVAHSLGSVIAYDCLKRVRPCPAVTSLMTIGSPLGIDEVQDRLRPEWTREDGYPSETLESQWITVYDSLDPVTGFDGNIANDFKKAGREVIEVINEENWGAWRHDAGKYLRGPKLRAALSHALDL